MPRQAVTPVTELLVPETKRLLAPVLLAAMIGGCSADLSSFSITELNPLKGSDPLRSADYNYFYKRDQGVTGVVTAADLVGPDGRCAFDPAPTYSPPPASAPDSVAQAPAAAEPINPRSNQALYFTTGPASDGPASGNAALPPQLRGGPSGIALQMTECEVVRVAGSTDRVEIGTNERGQRSVTLTYLSGGRPGIYRFVAGRLASMERVAEPPQPRKPVKAARAAKKSAPRQ